MTPRWTRIALIVSLALNLLVAGLVAGALLHGPLGGRDGRPEIRMLGLGPFADALTKADRAALGEAIRREEGSFRARREAMRADFDAFLAALRAEPYDHAEVTRLIASQQQRIAESQRLARGLLLERIETMAPAERAAYAEALDDATRRRHRRRD
jgi:uncharacterized membrane protein